MPTVRFSSAKDAKYLRRRAAEKDKLYRVPRRWLVHNESITTNIYGEPGAPVTGTDGISSVAATRQFTSSTSNFTTAGVQASDILEVKEEACNSGDNGRYIINSVVNSTTLEINQDWPVGNLTGLKFIVHILKERYTEFDQLVPFLVKLNPTEKTLEKWGLNEKRDAMVEISAELCDEIDLSPKIGDRFIYPYDDRDIHYEIKNLFEANQNADSGITLHYVGFAMRTANHLP